MYIGVVVVHVTGFLIGLLQSCCFLVAHDVGVMRVQSIYADYYVVILNSPWHEIDSEERSSTVIV